MPQIEQKVFISLDKCFGRDRKADSPSKPGEDVQITVFSVDGRRYTKNTCQNFDKASGNCAISENGEGECVFKRVGELTVPKQEKIEGRKQVSLPEDRRTFRRPPKY